MNLGIIGQLIRPPTLVLAVAPATSADIVVTHKTDDVSISNPTLTTSITPVAGSQVFVSVAIAGSTDPGTLTVSGCNLTWTQISILTYSTRRTLCVYRGTGASPTAGQLTLTFTPDLGVFQEMMFSVDECTGVNAITPTSNTATNTTLGSNDFGVTIGGTVDSGDFTFFVCGKETNEAITPEASLTTLTNRTGGANIRCFYVGYDGTVTVDQSPSATWVSTDGAGAIGFIIEKS